MLLDVLQDDLPLVPRPWAAIADRLGSTEDDVLERLGRLQETGVIRGVSPVLESRRLGLMAATLVALRVPKSRVSGIARIISSYPEVSHNYRRDHAYSIWFTLAAPTAGRIGEVLAEILGRTGISPEDVLNLPTLQKYKIDVRFSCCPDNGEAENHGPD
jgi:DNA-binding Lrp family transcriptional regulator